MSTESLASRSRILDEHRSAFCIPTRHARIPMAGHHPYRQPARVQLWSHNFLCLASRFTGQVPERQEKEELKSSGLEERIHIGLKASAQQLHQKFLLVYPKLENAGGYELLRCLPNSRSLTRLQPPSGGHTPESLKGDVGQVRKNIRPLQRDLDTTPIQNTASEAVSQPSTQNAEVCIIIIILVLLLHAACM